MYLHPCNPFLMRKSIQLRLFLPDLTLPLLYPCIRIVFT